MARLYIPDPAIEWPHESTARAHALPVLRRARRARRVRDPVVERQQQRERVAELRQPARPLSLGSEARRRDGDSPALLFHVRGESVTGAPAQPVALVTGGGRGIGREIALVLAREGCHVAVAARSADQVTRSEERRVGKECRSRGSAEERKEKGRSGTQT